MVERMAIARRDDDSEAYQLLAQLAPEYLKEWLRRDGLSVQRFYRHAFTSQGDVRSDRPTIPIVGSLFTMENAQAVRDRELRIAQDPPCSGCGLLGGAAGAALGKHFGYGRGRRAVP